MGFESDRYEFKRCKKQVTQKGGKGLTKKQQKVTQGGQGAAKKLMSLT